MAHETNFNDALDYIYIANTMNDNAYLIAEPQPDLPDDDHDKEQEDEDDDEKSLEVQDTNNNKQRKHYYGSVPKKRKHFPSTLGMSPPTTDHTAAPTSPLTTAALAAAAASASVAAAAARITAKAAHRALTTAGGSLNGKEVAMATATATATATTLQLIDLDNNYTNVAVGLGAMLLNDTLLLDGISSSSSNSNDSMLGLFGVMVNQSGQLDTANGNGTAINVTTSEVAEDDFTHLLRMAVTSVLLGLMILVTIIGNVFVIAAIILERNLQNVANYLVASLAVADLFVACLVMPLGAVYEISQGWILGPELCDIWTSCDVLCCTASILHLVAIAVDRYWAVTNIDYIHSRTSNRVFMMIFCVWTASVIVSLAPQFGWKDPDYLQRIEQQKCMVSQDVSYQVFATCCTFYVPLLVILALYWKIYQTARKRIHRRRPRPVAAAVNNNQPDGGAATDTKLNRLRLRLGRFSTAKTKSGNLAGGAGGAAAVGAGGGGGSTGTALCLVEGNSTNTVNTVEDTEFSSSNVDSKSRAGVEAPSSSGNQIATVSHLVALAKQQGQAATKSVESNGAVEIGCGGEHEPAATTATSAMPAVATGITASAAAAAAAAPATAAASPTATAEAAAADGEYCEEGKANGSGAAVEVLEDPQLQQQLEQVQQLQKNSKSGGGGGGGGASTSNATTITSISALSPQTPTTPTVGGGPGAQQAAGPMTAKTSTLTSCNQEHPLCASTSSMPVTPEPRSKQHPGSAHPAGQQQQLSSISNPMQKVNKRKETLEAKRERKAAKTLAIITGAFVVCWLPFFVMALTMPLCDACQISDSVASLFLWLGYFNSTLNPVIYTIFSPEFRQAFKRILFGGHRPVHYRSGKL
ncbi:5-hydroxytryptamine receptor 2A [Drosophila guanche]|uniref:Blast:5-hydroxytryptamine receptor 2A n=1 Tax=Drosophila guanche TaxID=7266 RepID=A0A3B0IZJ7_DROGU|nr:5-hydroxytryptamine receptor 2A [Drosophila guanche]XP_034141813.1 5-hydroxytryptamine receptor 2A [Drosophila guanche]SPP73645.1 blast:5-hydroxytryptamine receptor 2A [Drosophila guanche]